MVLSVLYEANFNSSPTATCLLAATPDATILAVNDAFLKGCGRRREDLLGASVFAVFPADPDDASDTGEHALRASLRRVMATGVADHLPVQRYPILMEQADGSTQYEERFWTAVSAPIYAADGEVLCISHSTTDVTELVRTEAAAKESEIRFRALVNAASDVIYRMSPDWQFMHELDGRGFLKTTSGLAEYKIEEYVYPADLERTRNAIAQAIRTKTIFALEHRVVRADQSPGWTYSKAVPILDADGEIREWIGMASDITERKAAEEQLNDASRRKDEFLAMLAHELRNPLAPIGAAAQLLQLGRLNDEQVRKTSEVIGRQVSHMTGLIDDLLDVSRVTRGLIELDKATLDIHHVVNDAVEQVNPLIRARKHELVIRHAPQGGRICGDKKRLVQVVANVLNNAAKYTAEGGHLVVSTQVQASKVLIEVSDDGIGMTPEMANHAFDLFAQAERTSDRSSGGLGLGLSLVRSLVELHGGTVSCESDGLDRGSRFSISLPLLGEQADSASSGLVSDPSHAELPAPLRILVVDDNVDAAEMLKLVLEALGHEVMVEHRPHRALETARLEKPQAFLIDIGLPEIDGNELARRLRAQPDNRDAVLVAITGYGQDSDRLDALAAGFDHHLVKPVDTSKLFAILSELKAA
jgi:PAS domain S-box-containing protein